MKCCPCILVFSVFLTACGSRQDGGRGDRSSKTLTARPNEKLQDFTADVVSVELKGPAVVFLYQNGEIRAVAVKNKDADKVLLPLASVLAKGSYAVVRASSHPSVFAAFRAKRPGGSAADASQETTDGPDRPCTDICNHCMTYDRYGNVTRDEPLDPDVCCGVQRVSPQDQQPSGSSQQ